MIYAISYIAGAILFAYVCGRVGKKEFAAFGIVWPLTGPIIALLLLLDWIAGKAEQ